MHDQKSDQQSYWDNKILEWEGTMYAGNARVSLLERLAVPFRTQLKKRLLVAEELVKNHVADRSLCDLGCGSGVFIVRLLKYNPRNLVGVDIAPSGIEAAKRHASDLGITESRVSFLCEDARVDSSFLQEVDIVTGIGLLDYFQKHEIASLFRAVKGKMFLFSLPTEGKLGAREILRGIYLKIASCPGSYSCSRGEVDGMLTEAGIDNYWYYDRESIRFVTNLPKT